MKASYAPKLVQLYQEFKTGLSNLY